MPTQELAQLTAGVPFVVAETQGPALSSVESAILEWIVPSPHTIAPHWSRTRDRQLRQLWRQVDAYKLAVSTFVNKAVTIPLRIQAVDRAVKAHVRQAQSLEVDIRRNSGLLRGWKNEFKKFNIDYLTQDNGAFMLVMGRGSVNRPLLGPALGIYHLDAAHCTRTGDPEFPVLYTHSDSTRYALHYSRVIYLSNLPSPELELNDVGHSPVSCALDAGVELRDVYTYMQEKLGSRPKRQILYAKKGTTLDKLREAIEYADDKMDGEGLRRFSKTVLLAPKNPNGELELDMVDMARTPDNFNRRDIAIIDISSIAAAFGLSIDDLTVAYAGSSSARGDSEVQERKGRGKGVGELLESTLEQLVNKLLPETLTASFDNQDDQQDEQQANIWDTRSTARQRDLTTGATTVSVERARMLRLGEITEEEYEEMELLDGRLPNGLDVLSLFYSDDPEFVRLLSIGIENPTIVADNDPVTVLSALDDLEQAAYVRVEKAPTAGVARKAKQALAAMQRLRSLYQMKQQEEEAQRQQEELLRQETQPEPPEETPEQNL